MPEAPNASPNYRPLVRLGRIVAKTELWPAMEIPGLNFGEVRRIPAKACATNIRTGAVAEMSDPYLSLHQLEQRALDAVMKPRA